MIRYYYDRITSNLRLFFKWLLLASITGLVVGALSSLFAFCMNYVTAFRAAHTYIIYFLPAAGCFIVFLYSLFQYKNDKGTNLVLSTIHAESELPFRMAPLIFISTVITHLFGGSAGREGAALQLGGSIGNQLGRWMHLDENDTRVIVMCGMSAAFSAVFGTPMAAAIFSLEVVSVGIMYYAALMPCIFSSIIASTFSAKMGIDAENFTILNIPDLHIIPAAKITILAMLCGALSVLFCMLLHGTGNLFRKYLKNPYIRIITASLMILLLTRLLGTTDYLGAGIPIIDETIHTHVEPMAFLWKMIFTAITLEAGFRGGEIVPSFFIGATFGCLFGTLTGISPSLCAATGMIAVFCGVTNCPITSMFISFELFGFAGVPYFLIAISVSYLLSGYYGLYKDQTIVYSKYKTQFVNRKTHDEDIF